MESASPERFHLYRPPSDPNAPFPGMILATFGVWLFYQSTNQVMIQRVLGARSVWDGKMGIIFAAIINLVRPLVCCFLGFFVYHWIHVLDRAPELADKDFAWPFALETFGPSWGLRGIILAGFLAAIMSTISSLGNSTATIVSLDIYKRHIKKNATDRQQVLVGRIVTVAALVIAALVAPNISKLGGIFRYFQTGVTYLATPFVSVIILGFFWKRTNYPGALFGLFGGVVITAVLAIAIGNRLNWLYVAAIAQVLIMSGIIVVSLLTPPPPEEKWKPFHWTPSMLRGEAALQPRPWYHSLWLWYGLFAVIWVALYVRFW
jgi:SSS family solute:Na+ symporter